MTVLQRRRTYAAPLWSADAFVLRHIGGFVRPRLESLVKRGGAVLDAGCGEQPLRGEIEAAGATYTGLDVEQNRDGTVEVIAPLWQVPLPDASADVIVVTEVLEHVAETDAAFTELARLLRKGGAILITTPFAYPLHELPHDYVRLTTAAIARLAERNGLRVAEAHALGNEIEVLAVTFNNLLSNILAPLPFALRAAAALVRLPLNVLVNVTASIFSAVLGSVLPKKSYLTTAAVLTK
ncbi:MAG TPA: methyltransferase domain-containing protein [Thermoanaerobaculia bacterium]|nr:methyltransferase domain-containing protein [Thermoanaerobaculia bacterium]